MLMPIACQQFAFWKGEGDREERKGKGITSVWVSD